MNSEYQKYTELLIRKLSKFWTSSKSYGNDEMKMELPQETVNHVANEKEMYKRHADFHQRF